MLRLLSFHSYKKVRNKAIPIKHTQRYNHHLQLRPYFSDHLSRSLINYSDNWVVSYAVTSDQPQALGNAWPNEAGGVYGGKEKLCGLFSPLMVDWSAKPVPIK